MSEEVLEFAQAYVQLLKPSHRGSPTHGKEAVSVTLTPERRHSVSQLFDVAVRKMRYDDSYDHETEADDEIAFQGFRKTLKVLFENIAKLDIEVALRISGLLVERTVQQVLAGSSVKPADIELALFTMYLLGQVVPGPHFGDSRCPLMPLMLQVLSLPAASLMHPAVALMFFDVCIRHGSFFRVADSQYVRSALTIFLGDVGIRSAAPAVRSRSTYLFLRFVKSCVRDQLGPFATELTRSVGPFLQPEVAWSPAAEGTEAPYLQPDDQLFLYEAVGCVITSASLPGETRAAGMEQLLAPQIERFTELLAKASVAQGSPEQEVCVRKMGHIMSSAVSLSKGISGPTALHEARCVPIFSRALAAFMQALQLPYERHVIRIGVRTFLHRMIVCMGEGILPLIPEALSALFSAQM